MAKAIQESRSGGEATFVVARNSSAFSTCSYKNFLLASDFKSFSQISLIREVHCWCLFMRRNSSCEVQ